MAARTSCSAAAQSGRARLNKARPAAVATSSWRRLSPKAARSIRPAQQRPQVARQRRAVGGEMVRELRRCSPALALHEAEQRELRDLEAGRRQVLAVDLRHAPRGASDAEAGAFGGREAERWPTWPQTAAAACAGQA